MLGFLPYGCRQQQHSEKILILGLKIQMGHKLLRFFVCFYTEPTAGRNGLSAMLAALATAIRT
jgi:hypothetical protein